MASDEALRRLAKLGRRERDVAKLVCGGLLYKEIAHYLGIATGSVKTHMRRVYIKLELDQMRPRQRLTVLNEVFCPLLTSRALAVIPTPPEPAEDEEEVVPEDDPVLQLVEEDERLLALYRKPKAPAVVKSEQWQVQPAQLDPQVVEGKIRLAGNNHWRLRLMIIGAVLVGMLLMGGAVWAWTIWQGATPTPVAQASTPVPTEPPAPTQAPGVTREVIVITATPLPVTMTPRPSATARRISTATQSLPPTAAPSPTLARPPDTPPGTRLRPGETWTQDGFRLTLTKHYLLEFQGEGEIGLEFEMANVTGADLTVSLDIRDVTLETNTATQFTLFNCSGQGLIYQRTLPSASRQPVFLCSSIMYFHGNYFAPDVTAVYVTVRNWSRIAEAVWQIDINK